jgi:hypothetical protein
MNGVQLLQSKNSILTSKADFLPNLSRKVIRIMVQGLCYANIGYQDVKKRNEGLCYSEGTSDRRQSFRHSLLYY